MGLLSAASKMNKKGGPAGLSNFANPAPTPAKARQAKGGPAPLFGSSLDALGPERVTQFVLSCSRQLIDAPAMVSRVPNAENILWNAINIIG